jgi:hypothetical protein
MISYTRADADARLTGGLEGLMSKVATEMETIWRAPDGAGASQRRSPLHFFGLHRARAVALRFLEALVPPRASPLSSEDKIDWPKFPLF